MARRFSSFFSNHNNNSIDNKNENANNASYKDQFSLTDKSLSGGDFVVVANTLKSYKGSDSNVVIPSNLNITSIGQRAFANCSTVKSIKIPSSVTSIGNKAFSNCSKLTNIDFPSSLNNIGNNAFENCSSLKSITLPDNALSLGTYIFYNCSNLTNVNLPRNLRVINDYAFYKCVSLREIVLPDNLTSIGQKAFSNCDSLAKIDFPSSLTTLGNCVFEKCSSLKYVFITANIKYYGEGVFFLCSNLEQIQVDNNNPTLATKDGILFSRDFNRIYQCPAKLNTMNEYYVPEIVSHICFGAFSSCDFLQKIYIPDNLRHIETSAFQSCTNLMYIRLPRTVSSFAKNLFNNCTSLTSIDLPENITKIEFGTFLKCKSLTDINIPNSVQVIEDIAFMGCSELRNITFPPSLQAIGKNAFSECHSLELVEIGPYTTALHVGCFNNCRSLYAINVDEDNNAFSSDDGILYSKNKNLLHIYPAGKFEKEFTIPSHVKSISEQAFLGCKYLERVIITTRLERIELSTFSTCEKLNTIIIKCAITYIDAFAFRLCPNLKNISFEGNVEKINDNCFTEIPSDLVFYCTPESYAYEFAKKHNISTRNEKLQLAKLDPVINYKPDKEQSSDLFVPINDTSHEDTPYNDNNAYIEDTSYNDNNSYIEDTSYNDNNSYMDNISYDNNNSYGDNISYNDNNSYIDNNDYSNNNYNNMPPSTNTTPSSELRTLDERDSKFVMPKVTDQSQPNANLPILVNSALAIMNSKKRINPEDNPKSPKTDAKVSIFMDSDDDDNYNNGNNDEVTSTDLFSKENLYLSDHILGFDKLSHEYHDESLLNFDELFDYSQNYLNVNDFANFFKAYPLFNYDTYFKFNDYNDIIYYHAQKQQYEQFANEYNYNEQMNSENNSNTTGDIIFDPLENNFVDSEFNDSDFRDANYNYDNNSVNNDINNNDDIYTNDVIKQASKDDINIEYSDFVEIDNSKDTYTNNYQDNNIQVEDYQDNIIQDRNYQDESLQDRNFQDENLQNANLQDANYQDANYQNNNFYNTNSYENNSNYKDSQTNTKEASEPNERPTTLVNLIDQPFSSENEYALIAFGSSNSYASNDDRTNTKDNSNEDEQSYEVIPNRIVNPAHLINMIDAPISSEDNNVVSNNELYTSDNSNENNNDKDTDTMIDKQFLPASDSEKKNIVNLIDKPISSEDVNYKNFIPNNQFNDINNPNSDYYVNNSSTQDNSLEEPIYNQIRPLPPSESATSVIDKPYVHDDPLSSRKVYKEENDNININTDNNIKDTSSDNMNNYSNAYGNNSTNTNNYSDVSDNSNIDNSNVSDNSNVDNDDTTREHSFVSHTFTINLSDDNDTEFFPPISNAIQKSTNDLNKLISERIANMNTTQSENKTYTSKDTTSASEDKISASENTTSASEDKISSLNEKEAETNSADDTISLSELFASDEQTINEEPTSHDEANSYNETTPNNEANSYNENKPHDETSNETSPYSEANSYEETVSYNESISHDETSSYSETEPSNETSPYEETNPYGETSSYSEAEPSNETSPYEETNPYGETSSYSETEPSNETTSYGEASPYSESNSYNETNAYGEASSYDEPEPNNETSSYEESSPYSEPNSYNEAGSYENINFDTNRANNFNNTNETNNFNNTNETNNFNNTDETSDYEPNFVLHNNQTSNNSNNRNNNNDINNNKHYEPNFVLHGNQATESKPKRPTVSTSMLVTRPCLPHNSNNTGYNTPNNANYNNTTNYNTNNTNTNMNNNTNNGYNTNTNYNTNTGYNTPNNNYTNVNNTGYNTPDNNYTNNGYNTNTDYNNNANYNNNTNNNVNFTMPNHTPSNDHHDGYHNGDRFTSKTINLKNTSSYTPIDFYEQDNDTSNTRPNNDFVNRPNNSYDARPNSNYDARPNNNYGNTSNFNNYNNSYEANATHDTNSIRNDNYINTPNAESTKNEIYQPTEDDLIKQRIIESLNHYKQDNPNSMYIKKKPAPKPSAYEANSLDDYLNSFDDFDESKKYASRSKHTSRYIKNSQEATENRYTRAKDEYVPVYQRAENSKQRLKIESKDSYINIDESTTYTSNALVKINNENEADLTDNPSINQKTYGKAIPIIELDKSQPTNSNYELTNKVMTSDISNVVVKQNTSTSILMTWTPIPYAAEYDIVQFNHLTQEYDQITCTSGDKTIITGLIPGLNHQYKIIAYRAETTVTPEGEEIVKNIPFATSKTINVQTSIPPVANFEILQVTHNSITLTWEISKGALKYIIYQYKPAENKYVKFDETKKNVYKIINLTPGTLYKYKISAVLRILNSECTSPLSEKAEVVTKMVTPTGLALVSNSENSLEIRWDPIDGIAIYEIFMLNKDTQNYEKISTIEENFLEITNLEPSTSYTIQVKACNIVDNKLIVGPPAYVICNTL